MQGDSVNNEALRSAQFATTCWTMVVAAGQEDSPAARHAMEFLYQRYWSPLYFYLRRRGHDRSQAEDLADVNQRRNPGAAQFENLLLKIQPQHGHAVISPQIGHHDGVGQRRPVLTLLESHLGVAAQIPGQRPGRLALNDDVSRGDFALLDH